MLIIMVFDEHQDVRPTCELEERRREKSRGGEITFVEQPVQVNIVFVNIVQVNIVFVNIVFVNIVFVNIVFVNIVQVNIVFVNIVQVNNQSIMIPMKM